MKRSLSLRRAVDFYLRSRRQLGFDLKTDEKLLRSLLAHADRVDHEGPLTETLVLEWARLPAEANPIWWAKRLLVVRRFGRFWQAFDPKVQVPPAGVFGSANRRRPVHIYTAKEISLLLQSAASLPPAHGLRSETFKTLLGLLACTGLRISEALKLQVSDFDHRAGKLMIWRSKAGQSRIVPLQPSSVRALVAYQSVCQKRRWRSTANAFFLSEIDTPLAYETARNTFSALRKRLNWVMSPRPRLHDLRHTFAVNRLLTWQRQKGDAVNQKVLALATYLGHRNIRHTNWYLSAIPELLAVASGRLAASRREVAHE
jgi:integrase